MGESEIKREKSSDHASDTARKRDIERERE